MRPPRSSWLDGSAAAGRCARVLLLSLFRNVCVSLRLLGMTTRSWWGWGTVEDAVTVDERRELVSRVRAVLPDADLTFHAAPDPHALDVPPPRISPPGDLYSFDVVDRLAHARGQAYRDVTRNLAGEV